ncbi:MAG: multiheme c-type cytochrome [Chthoniobacterales bacterium]
MDRRLFFVLLALPMASATAAGPRQTRTEEAHFVGAQNCSSSSCHGGAGEKRSQYFTWARRDFHTRAFAILTNARSERIASSLGIENATDNSRCTSCHAPLHAVASTRLAARIDPNVGVSCESCHGVAGTWLRGHTRPDWTYATRVGAGMRDLKSFYVRANTCVACHQNLEADLSAAGHPDLIFELDAQSLTQPKHWRDPEGSGPRAWLAGQAVALRETSWKLAQNPDANPQTLAQWHGLVWLLAKVTASDALGARIEPPAAGQAGTFASTQQQADALARRAAKQNLDPAFMRRLHATLAATSDEFRETADAPPAILFTRAQRLILALEALDAETRAGAEHTNALRHDVRTFTEFDPAQFAAHLEKLRDGPIPATVNE